MIEPSIPLIDEILGAREDLLGKAHAGYRNHVYRMVNFCFAQREFSDEERTKLIIAGCFHDIGIWTAGTFDYLPPSIDAANEYLAKEGLDGWMPEIDEIIDQHHKLRPVDGRNFGLVETFRKGDLIDFSLGLIGCGVARETIRSVKAQFPNRGFHKGLVRVAAHWICRHPLRPVPVAKW